MNCKTCGRQIRNGKQCAACHEKSNWILKKRIEIALIIITIVTAIVYTIV